MGGGGVAANLTTPPPPNTIPEAQLNEFSLGGKIPIIYSYCDSRVIDSKPFVNTAKTYKKVFKQLAKRTFEYYGSEIFAFYDALSAYPIEGKTVIVWGLAGCNCEAIALFYKAAKVFVVDYNKPVCEHPNIEVLSHEELKKSGIRADAAFSYSSFEHDGLGRYGDPISPDGDLRAMSEAREFLADDGLLFLGVPLGQDCLVWNANRIYGKIRLPMLLKGFRAEDVFDVYGAQSGDYPFDLPLGDGLQSILVCRKIDTDYPSDDELAAETGAPKSGKTHRPDMLARINRVTLEHKRNATRQ